METKRKVVLVLFLFLIMVSVGNSTTRITDNRIETTGNITVKRDINAEGNIFIGGHIEVLDYITAPKINAYNISTDSLRTDSLNVDNITADVVAADILTADNGYTGSCINTTYLNGIAVSCND